MLSNFMSEYLYSLCPQASVKISYEKEGRVHNFYYDADYYYPSATFEFQSKGDFEKGDFENAKVNYQS